MKGCRLSLAHITKNKHMDHTGTILPITHSKGTAQDTQKGHCERPHRLVSNGISNLRNVVKPLALVTLQVVQ